MRQKKVDLFVIHPPRLLDTRGFHSSASACSTLAKRAHERFLLVGFDQLRTFTKTTSRGSLCFSVDILVSTTPVGLPTSQPLIVSWLLGLLHDNPKFPRRDVLNALAELELETSGLFISPLLPMALPLAHDPEFCGILFQNASHLRSF